MGLFLKQSTAVTVKIGPFVDSTDGNTVESGLTISQADVLLSKNGGAFTQKTEATSCTHDAIGYYGCPLDATDTGTLGRLQLAVHESGALPVYHEYMVVRADVYDTMCSTDYLQVDVIQVGSGTQSATDLKDFADTGYDPATHKVQGVVLTDTTTAITNPVNLSAASEAQIDAIETDTNEIQGKLPTNKIMGSSVVTDKDDEIDAIKTMTDKIGTIVNTGGTATIGAVLGDFANSALVTRVGAGAAQSATALSTANWTAARAGYLDNINNANLATVPAISAARIGYLDNINQAGLLQVTAARAGYLDNVNQSGLLQVTAARAGYLDNINNAGLATITPTTIWNLAVEGAITAKQATELMLAVLCGKTSEAVAGTMVIRDANDTVDRITATMDANRYRTGVVLNP
jgi:hypothetical protein